MAENKIVFGFDLKGQESVLKLLKDLQKETSVLGEKGAKDIESLSREFEGLTKLGSNIKNMEGTLKALSSVLGDVDNQLIKTFSVGQKGAMFEGLTALLDKVQGKIKGIGSGLTEDIRKASDPFVAPELRDRAQSSATSSTSQINLLSTIATKLTEQLDMMKKSQGEAAVGAAGPSGSLPPSGRGGGTHTGGTDWSKATNSLVAQGFTFGGLSGAIKGLLGSAGPVGLGVLTAGATATSAYNAYGPEGQSSFEAIMAQSKQAAAREAMSGDFLRQTLRQQGLGTGSRLAKDPMGFRGPGEFLFAGKSALGALADSIFRGADLAESYQKRTLAGTEEPDKVAYRQLGDAQSLQTNTILGTNRRDAFMLGDAAVLRGVQNVGGTEETTRAGRNLITRFLGRESGGVDTDFTKSNFRFGMGEDYMTQIARLSGKGGIDRSNTMGLGLLGAAGLTSSKDLFSRESAGSYIAHQGANAPITASILDVGGAFAGVTGGAMNLTSGFMGGPLSGAAKESVVKSSVGAHQSAHSESQDPSSYRFAMEISALMSRGLTYGEASTAVSMGLEREGGRFAAAAIKQRTGSKLSVNQIRSGFAKELGSDMKALSKAKGAAFGGDSDAMAAGWKELGVNVPKGQMGEFSGAMVTSGSTNLTDISATMQTHNEQYYMGGPGAGKVKSAAGRMQDIASDAARSKEQGLEAYEKEMLKLPFNVSMAINDAYKTIIGEFKTMLKDLAVKGGNSGASSGANNDLRNQSASVGKKK